MTQALTRPLNWVGGCDFIGSSHLSLCCHSNRFFFTVVHNVCIISNSLIITSNPFTKHLHHNLKKRMRPTEQPAILIMCSCSVRKQSSLFTQQLILGTFGTMQSVFIEKSSSFQFYRRFNLFRCTVSTSGTIEVVERQYRTSTATTTTKQQQQQQHLRENAAIYSLKLYFVEVWLLRSYTIIIVVLF